METKLVLEDGISVGGKNLREIYEQVNHQKAFCYVKDCIGEGRILDEKIIKDIHPYPDGNGRTSRLIMNYQLMANGFAPISIDKKDRLDYFNALEAYAVEGDIGSFAEIVAGLEEVQLDRYLAMIEQAQGMRRQL